MKIPLPCLLFERRDERFFIKEANSSYCRMTGVEENQLVGKPLEEVFPENPSSKGFEQVNDSLEFAYSSGKPHKIKNLRYDLYSTAQNDFEVKYWDVENVPVSNEKGNIQYVLNTVVDITPEVMERNRCDLLEVKLNTKTENHEQLLKKISDGLFSLDLKGNFISLNKGLVEIAETSKVDLLKMNFLPFCGAKHREKIVKKFNAAIGGRNQRFEADFVSGKGREMILEISLVPLKNNGIVKGLYGIAKNITRLKEAEDALLKSERKFKALVQEGADLIGILDIKGKYKFVSETSIPVLGIAPEEFIGKTAFDFIHPEDRERVMEEFSSLGNQDHIQVKPFRFKNKEGEWRWVETKATNLTNDPAVGGIVTNSRDVTESIKAQRKIKESEERYRSFFENSLDAILVTIPTGQILAANPSACKMFQRSEEELCRLGRKAVVDPTDSRLEKALKLREDTGSASLELTFLRKDGSKFEGEITSNIFKNADNAARSSMIIRDITERKMAQDKLLELNHSLKKNTRELIRANKGLEQFSYIISHNLRAPVANILGLAQLLNDREYTGEIRMNLRDEIESNAQRMDGVIKDLNQILQVKNDFSEVKQLIDLNELVQSIKVNLKDKIKKEKISIITNFEAIRQIESISSFFYSIFYNLIFNSIKFRRPGINNILRITSKREKGTVKLIFEDNGLGMDIHTKKKEIFGLYKRFHHHVEGKGMGLFMVKTQVEMLGGKINLLSKINEGSTFILEFKEEIVRI